MKAASEGRAVAWFLAIVLGVVNAASHAFDLYARFWWFGRVLHACTILAVKLWPALFVCRRARRGAPGRDAPLALVAAGVGLAVGALREVAEWVFDRIRPRRRPQEQARHHHRHRHGYERGALGGAASLEFLRPEETWPAAAPSVAPETP
jgi:hypothetical protein